MKFPCIIDQTKTLKKGMKITLAIKDEKVKDVLRDIHNFHDRDILVTIAVDADKEQDKLRQITNEQRKKIYALFRDIADYTGNNKDHIKDEMKKKFISNTDYSKTEISFADCSKDEASDFIEYTINFCFEYGIGIKDNPKDYFDDIERAMQVFIKQKICCVCGKPGEVHHVDAIGMGRNRKTVDDSQSKKACLCREHHTEAHQIGWDTFKDKYHSKGVIVDG